MFLTYCYICFYYQENTLEYNRYLKEVVNLLENDAKFKEKLESAKPEDIRVSESIQHVSVKQVFFQFRCEI